MSRLMTRKEAAVFARRTTRTIDRWLRDPDVPIKPYGNHRVVLVDRIELEAYLGLAPALV